MLPREISSRFFNEKEATKKLPMESEISHAERIGVAQVVTTVPVLDKDNIRQILTQHVSRKVSREAVLGSLIYFYFDQLDLIFEKVKVAQLSNDRFDIVESRDFDCLERTIFAKALYTAQAIRVLSEQDLDEILKVMISSLRKLLRAYSRCKEQDENVQAHLEHLGNFEKFIRSNKGNMTSQENFVSWQLDIDGYPALPRDQYRAVIESLSRVSRSN